MRPAQHHADARQQFARLEGLGDVVFRADFEAHHAVHRIATRGQHDDRYRCRCRRMQAADFVEKIEAVRIGKHQVEENEVRPACA